MDMERIQVSAMKKMMKGLEHLSGEKRLRAAMAQPGGEKAQTDLISVFQYPKGRCQEDRSKLSSGPL